MYPTCAWSSKKAIRSLISSDWSWVCCWMRACLWLKNLTAATSSAGEQRSLLDWSNFNLWVTILPRPLSHRQFRSGESEQPRGESAATSSSSPGNVPPSAPAAESAPKLWNHTGTSQTGTARPGLARRETRHLVHYQDNILVKAFKQEPWRHPDNLKKRWLLIPNMANFTLLPQGIEPSYVTFCFFVF